MTQERINALNATEGWKWEDDPFQENFEHLITQYQKKRNKKPSESSKDEEERRAGKWQSKMRKAYKNKKTCMTQERINALNATEGWTWKDDPFQENLEHWIAQYKKKGNETPSQSSKDKDEKRAAKWQSKMRTDYKKKKKWITQERIDALNDTEGWKWEGR